MPAYTVTPQLRFISRLVTEPDPRFAAAVPQQRVLRILQQRWCVRGTLWAEMNDENSEWRDVPLVEEVPTTSASMGYNRMVEGG